MGSSHHQKEPAMRSRTILSTVAAATLFIAVAPAFAQPGHGDRDHRGPPAAHRDAHGHRDAHPGRHAGPPAHAYGARGPQWRPGRYVPPEYRARAYVVDNWRAYRLPAPRRGYHWIQVGADFVLVANINGVIAQIVLG
jgi:Ni/Co efflux regulator RcnB